MIRYKYYRFTDFKTVVKISCLILKMCTIGWNPYLRISTNYVLVMKDKLSVATKNTMIVKQRPKEKSIIVCYTAAVEKRETCTVLKESTMRMATLWYV